MSKSPIEIIEEYIQMLRRGDVKEGLREASSFAERRAYADVWSHEILHL